MYSIFTNICFKKLFDGKNKHVFFLKLYFPLPGNGEYVSKWIR